MATVRILGSRAREQVPGTSITLLAPGFRGALTQLAPGVASAAAIDLPCAEAAAGADVMLAAQLTLQLQAQPRVVAAGGRAAGLRWRSAVAAHPRVIVPRRPGLTYALLQTDENGISSFVAPQPGDGTEAEFRLGVAAEGATRRTLRVLVWPESPPTGAGALAMVSRWERARRPHQLAQRTLTGRWQPPDRSDLARGIVLLLLHDSFSTSQAAFAHWLDDDSYSRAAAHHQGRCLAFTHPTLGTGIDENLEWLVRSLAGVPGPFDVVAHGRGGLLARALAVDGRMPLRRVCQVGVPHHGTAWARQDRLPRFLDAHVALLATLPGPVALGTLEGALCLARCVAQGPGAALPGVVELTPEGLSRRAREPVRSPSLEWFTIGAEFAMPTGHGPQADDPDCSQPNDGVVPAQACHDPGMPVADSLHLRGSFVHHHNYFQSPLVRERLTAWLC